MEISCLVCSKNIVIPDYYDVSNYDGQIICPDCRSLLHIKLAASKLRKLEIVGSTPAPAAVKPAGNPNPVDAVSTPSIMNLLSRNSDNISTESIARYNKLRDFLTTYHAVQLHMAFEQIEGMIGGELPTEAYTFKSWWANNRHNPQAIAWMEAGWEIFDVDLQQKCLVLRRTDQPESSG
jgi:hypothetical protein